MTQELDGPVLDLGTFDLEAEADRGASMDLLAPRADKQSGLTRAAKTGIVFTVLGDDSPTFRRNLRAMVDERQANLASEPKDPDTLEKLNSARIAACCVTDWTDNVLLNGEKLEYSRDNAIKLFFERPWIARQVESFRLNVGNFGPR